MADSNLLPDGQTRLMRDNKKGSVNEIVESTFDPIGVHQWFSGTSIQTLTPPAGATLLMIQPHGQAILMTFDGTDPVPTPFKGFVFAADNPPTIIPVGSAMIIKAQFGSSGGIVNYQWGTL